MFYSRIQHSKGTSALELVIVLTLVALMMMTGVPALSNYSLDKRMDSAITELLVTFRAARNAAVHQNHHIVVCPGDIFTGCQKQQNWHRGYMSFIDINGDSNKQPDEAVLYAGSHFENLTVIGSSNRPFARFSPSGAAPASNMSLVFCDHRGLRYGLKLVLSNTGRIRTTKLLDSDYSRCATPV